MNKPLTMTIKETKSKLINICNESGLPSIILDLIIGGIYSEIHSFAERQALEEELAYKEAEELANKKVEEKDSASIEA